MGLLDPEGSRALGWKTLGWAERLASHAGSAANLPVPGLGQIRNRTESGGSTQPPPSSCQLWEKVEEDTAEWQTFLVPALCRALCCVLGAVLTLRSLQSGWDVAVQCDKAYKWGPTQGTEGRWERGYMSWVWDEGRKSAQWPLSAAGTHSPS